MKATIQSLAQHVVPRALIILALIAAFFPVWHNLAYLWTHTFGYAHGWVIAGICLWLIFSDHTTLTPSERPLRGLLTLAAVLAVSIFVRFTFINAAEQLLIPIIAVALAYALFGAQGARCFAFPSFFFIFAVALWGQVIPAMQYATVHVVGHALSLIGIANSTYTDHIHIPFGTFVVERGCAGENFFVVALAVSTLNIRLWALSWRKGAFAVVFACALSLIANWLRVFLIIWRSWSTDMETGLIRNHYWFGWYLFAGTLLIYFLVMRRLDNGARPRSENSRGSSSGTLAGWPSALIGLVMLGLASFYTHLRVAALNGLTARLSPPPVIVGAWNGPVLRQLPWHPAFKAAAASSLTVYRDRTGHTVGLYRAVYTNEFDGGKLIGYGASVVPADWHELSAQFLKLNKAHSYTRTLRSVEQKQAVSADHTRWLIWSWYEIDGARYARPWRMKLAQGLQGFGLLAPSPSKVIALATRCSLRCARAQERLMQFSERLLLGDRK